MSLGRQEASAFPQGHPLCRHSGESTEEPSLDSPVTACNTAPDSGWPGNAKVCVTANSSPWGLRGQDPFPCTGRAGGPHHPEALTFSGAMLGHFQLYR